MVYFIQAGEFVKIGAVHGNKHSSVIKRLKDLQVANPLELRILGTMPGGFAMESMVHEMFSSSRVRGEWFHFTYDLSRFIKRPQAEVNSMLVKRNRAKAAEEQRARRNRINDTTARVSNRRRAKLHVSTNEVIAERARLRKLNRSRKAKGLKPLVPGERFHVWDQVLED